MCEWTPCRVLCRPGKELWVGTLGLIVLCFLSEDLYVKTRLQFDKTAMHLQNLESATRKAVCAAVKEFNKSQVYPGLSVWRGGKHTAASLGCPGLAGSRAQSIHKVTSPTPVGPCQGLPSYRDG